MVFQRRRAAVAGVCCAFLFLVFTNRGKSAENRPTLFIRGDTNSDKSIELTDAVRALNHLFLGGALECPDAADVNDDGSLDVTDPILLLRYLFLGGPSPELPFPTCGTDRRLDTLPSCALPACDLPSDFTNSVGMRMVYIPPGLFTMGSPRDERGRDVDEILHLVRLTCGFYVSNVEVTQQVFLDVMGYNPSRHNNEISGVNLERPVESVSWFEAMAFCDRLSDQEGLSYRLPTEAEWEYACRAGTQTRFWFGDALECNDRCGSCLLADESLYGCSTRGFNSIPIPVGQKEANPWGLHNLHGNVLEWCFDWYGPYLLPRGGSSVPVLTDPFGPETGQKKVLRGNAWGTLARGRSANRENKAPSSRSSSVGFRIVVQFCRPPSP